MTTHKFVEDAPLLGVKKTKDGYLAASVKCGRTGIQDYAGYEFGQPERERIRVYRPEEEVFAADSLRTFAHRPVTNDHPSEPVTAENWKNFAVGSIGDEVFRDGEFVRVPMLLMDAAAIKQVEDGKRELSLGYTTELSFEDGVTPDGEKYDAVMKDLRINHLAIVQKGRAGPEVRVGDSSAAHEVWGVSPIPAVNDGITERKVSMTSKTVAVDGLDIETNDIGAQAIEKLKTERQAAQDAASAAKVAHDAEMDRLKAAHDSAISAKDGELAAKDAEIAELKSKVLDDAALDKKVAERAALISKAQLIAKDADFSGKSDHEIKAAAVAAARGPEFAADKSEAYIAVAFDMLDVPAADTVREALITRTPAADAANDNGQAAYEARISGAYKEA